MSTKLNRVSSLTNIAALNTVVALPRIKSLPDILCNEDAQYKNAFKSKSLHEDALKDLRDKFDKSLSENVKMVKLPELNQCKVEEEKKLKFKIIEPFYLSNGKLMKNVDEIFIIKDGIRNYRDLNEERLNYIKEHLDKNQMFEIIEIYNLCLCNLLNALN
jgi:hypothetical protein